jgi:hypothetical protein
MKEGGLLVCFWMTRAKVASEVLFLAGSVLWSPLTWPEEDPSGNWRQQVSLLWENWYFVLSAEVWVNFSLGRGSSIVARVGRSEGNAACALKGKQFSADN